MKRFTVQCKFKGHRKRWPFHIYIAMPHDAFHPLQFQMAYLKLCDGNLPAAAALSFSQLQRYAQHYNVNYEDLIVHANSPANREAHKKSSRKLAPGFSKFKKQTSPSVLSAWWDKNPQLKPEIVCYAAEAILSSTHNASTFSKCLLQLLLLYTDKAHSLCARLKVIDERLSEPPNLNAEASKKFEFMYMFMVAADTYGSSLHRTTLKELWKLVRLPPGDQLLAVVDLRNVLEAWAMDKIWKMSEPKVAVPYDLAEVREELRQYFLPQQWKKKRQPTPSEMYQLSYDLYYGKTVPRSVLGTLAWCRKAANLGLARAQFGLGHLMNEQGDEEHALKWFKKSAAQNDPKGLGDVGWAYLWGRGTKKNIPVALKYFELASKAGLEKVAGDIGICYLKLRGKSNYSKAKEYFDVALTEQPEGYVLYHIAEMYKHGWGVKKSYSIAKEYYVKAEDAGYKFKKKRSKEKANGKS